MITLYGGARSSAGRCIWALEESGVNYEVKEIDLRKKEHKSPDFLKVNPNGKIPALTDGDLTLFESMAINFYIAEAYKKELLGLNASEKGQVLQWSFWSNSELQTPIIEILIQKFFIPENIRDNNLIENNLKKLPTLFNLLNNHLEGKKYLVENQFTLADLNTGSVVTIAKAINFNMEIYTNINSWVGTITDRPAYQKYKSLRG